QASRGPVFPTSTSAFFLGRPMRESSTDGMKNANKTTAAEMPPAAKVSVPTTNAARAPEAVSAWTRQAPAATSAAATAPISALVAWSMSRW
ncbi:MAG: hypothetical protein WCE44_15030, partial [Candidatus Velthaea sp.]